MAYIDTEKISVHLRSRAINLEENSILVTNYAGSEQEKDLTEPANCNGYGRIRHFKWSPGGDWVVNPLPILPVSKALVIPVTEGLRAQVFQNSVCNWRCWYCYVDFDLLKGDTKKAAFQTCDQLLDLYLAEKNPASLIDLSGGQPDLTPEWVPWMMEAIKDRGLMDKVFLWSDDNLSNDYIWRYLSDDQLNLLASYPMYSRVCCFKGLDRESFSVNTKADPVLFDNQFNLCRRLLDLGLDLYCYITLISPTASKFGDTVPAFLDRLQEIHPNLPLRTVPLKVFGFTPAISRITELHQDYMKGQHIALEIWNKEMEHRFTSNERCQPITDVTLKQKTS